MLKPSTDFNGPTASGSGSSHRQSLVFFTSQLTWSHPSAILTPSPGSSVQLLRKKALKTVKKNQQVMALKGKYM